MAARTNRPLHSIADRERIRTSQLVNRLQDFALSEHIELDANRIRAIEILLAKTLPNLASVEAFNHTEVAVISDKPLTPEAWEAAHGEPVSNPDHKNVN